MAKLFAYMWEYNVKTEYKVTFEKVYGPDGIWMNLLKKATGFVRSELLHDSLRPERYYTIDYWQSIADKGQFMITFSDEYNALDTDTAAFCVDEKLVGEFVVISS